MAADVQNTPAAKAPWKQDGGGYREPSAGKWQLNSFQGSTLSCGSVPVFGCQKPCTTDPEIETQ